MNKKSLFAAWVATAFALGSCHSEDLLSTTGDDTPGIGIELADIGIGTADASTRYDATAATASWDNGDQVIVYATAQESANGPLVNTFTATVSGSSVTWQQDAATGIPETLNGETVTRTFLTVENTGSINSLVSYGGRVNDVAYFAGGSGTNAPITEDFYKQCDYLLADVGNITTGTAGTNVIDKANHTITATLHHQRAEFVLTVKDGTNSLVYSDDDTSLNDAALRITISSGASDYRDYWAWNAGKTTDGKTTFRVILPVHQVNGTDAPIESVILYPYGDDNDNGSIDRGDVEKTVTLSRNGSTAPITPAAGRRYNATLIYNEYTPLTTTVILGDWTEESYNNGNEVGTGNPESQE